MSRGNGGGGIIGAYVVAPVLEYIKAVGFITAVVLVVVSGTAAAYVCTTIVTATFETVGIMVKQVPNARDSYNLGSSLVKAPTSTLPKTDGKSTAKKEK